MIEASEDEVKSLVEQYCDTRYSEFVESSVNQILYEHYYHHSFLVRLAALVEGIASNARILDIACGNAILSRKALRSISARLRFVGIDASPIMLQEAQRLSAAEGWSAEQLSLFCANVQSLPEELGLFDCIISGFFFGHADSKENLVKYFQTIYAHLSPGAETIHIFPLPHDCGDGADIKDGFIEKALLPLVGPDGSTSMIELYDYHWKEETYRWAAEQAGLIDFAFQDCKISESAIKNGTLQYADLHVRTVMLTCRKPLRA
jgi:ubiquinone/menaquinone biosynthesis C-methylase UbiE